MLTDESQKRLPHHNHITRRYCCAIATHNPFLASTIATTTRVQGWVFDIAAGRTQALLLSYTEQHAAILEAIQEGEPGVAAGAMQAHLEWALAHSKQEVRRRLGVEGV